MEPASKQDSAGLLDQARELVAELEAETVGLARSYRDWAGATQIVIPLTDDTRSPGALDTSALGDEQVVQELQQRDDRGVEERTGEEVLTASGPRAAASHWCSVGRAPPAQRQKASAKALFCARLP